MTGPGKAPGGAATARPRAARVGPVFVAYALAFVGIVALNLVALAIIHEMHPELPEHEVSLLALLAGSLATSTALVMTLAATVRPLDAQRLRLMPGRESGAALALIIIGTLALGQALGSATEVTGLAGRGAQAEIRRLLEGTTGADLFAAVLVIGPIAGAAEEIFFRGFMQTALSAAWRPGTAVAVAALAFAALHLEPLYATVALVIGLWLGTVARWTGRALPAVAAHVVNNVVFTILTALGLSLDGVRLNLIAGGISLLGFVAVVVALRRRF